MKQMAEFHPRGNGVLLPHGGLPEVVPPYLRGLIESTGGVEGPIGLQFVAQPEKERLHHEDLASDPLSEDEHEVAPGLVYKYKAETADDGSIVFPGRALWTLTRNCAAYCRFCTRGREVGIPAGMDGMAGNALSHTPRLSDEQIEQTLSFLRSNRGINEVVVSGGDPLTISPDTLFDVFGKLREMQDEGTLDIVRLGTRLPVVNPLSVKEKHYEAISRLRNPYTMIHINHPEELTTETIAVLDRFRKECGATVMSQTVLLKGVNDSVPVLTDLFNKMAKFGIRPYYVFQNDPVYWSAHMTVPIHDAIAIWSQVRPRLSGVAATARFVIDVPEGYGKIPVPEGDAWQIDYSKGYTDFRGTIFQLEK